MIEIETYDENGMQHIIGDAVVEGWSSHYGEDGSGFGYFRFYLKRPIGHNYSDIGFGYEFIARKYVNTLVFHGQIRQIDEESGKDGDRISITCIGWVIVAEDTDEVLRAYCDMRLDRWRPPGELAKGNFRPDLFTTGSGSTGLYQHPNNDQDVLNGDYTELQYQFYPGETAERFKCTLSMVRGAGNLFHGLIANIPFYGKVDSADNGTKEVVYKDDSNEETLQNGDVLHNTTRDETATIVSFDTGTNTITVGAGDDISAWVSDDDVEIDTPRIVYGWDAGEASVQPTMMLYNLTQDRSAEVESIDTANNFIVVTSKLDLSGWVNQDEIFVGGPAFRAQIDSVSGVQITYDPATEVGEGNIVSSWPIVNLTKKSVAEISSNVTGSDTIDVTDATHIEDWKAGDVIIVPASLWYAKVDSVINDGDGSGRIVYKNDIATSVVSVEDEDENPTVGWVVYNETRDEYATVDGWFTVSNWCGVDTWADISAWSSDDVLRIYTPLKTEIVDSAGNVIWPVSEWREGAIMNHHVIVNVEDAGTATPPVFIVRMTNFVAGAYSESSFTQLDDVKAYSDSSAITPVFLSQEMLAILDDSGHDMDPDASDIEAGLTNVTEPAVFEFMTPKEVMQWICSFGDSSGNRIAWGVRLDGRSRFFLETQDLDTIDYIIQRTRETEVSAGGDASESAQHVRGYYTDELGDLQITDWQTDSDAYFSGHLRKKSVSIDNVLDDTGALVAVDLYLEENKRPKRQSAYTVGQGAVFTPNKVPLPIDELKATGGMIVIEDWRSVEAGRSATDLRNTWTTEQIVAVEINYQDRTARLIPAAAKNSFEQYMAKLARMANL